MLRDHVEHLFSVTSDPLEPCSDQSQLFVDKLLDYQDYFEAVIRSQRCIEMLENKYSAETVVSAYNGLNSTPVTWSESVFDPAVFP